MAKQRHRSQSPKKADSRPRTTAEVQNEGAKKTNRSARGGRETVDALVVAFALAFLIRTFEAEQFVIPTGSMAPTLMGRHKDVDCAQCGIRFKVNASDESSETADRIRLIARQRRMSPVDLARRLSGVQVVGGSCPQCGYAMPLRDDGLTGFLPPGTPPVKDHPSYGGDRIVVRKYAYEFSDPDRWDVLVFKYPGDAKSNYIKRLVGLPGEELRLYQGDLFTRPVGSEAPYAIASKPADKVLAMGQPVHDTDHDPSRLYTAGWPLRWQGDDAAWQVTTKPDGKLLEQTYRCEATAKGPAAHWLRYHHTVPGEAVWDRVLASGDSNKLEFTPKRSLIMDQIAYNAGQTRNWVEGHRQFTNRPNDEGDLGHLGTHWVGDLMLEADVTIESSEGQLLLELVEAGTHYGLEIDLATGEGQLTRRGFGARLDETERIETAPTPVRGKGQYAVRLANVDDRLLAWIDGDLMPFEGRYAIATDLESRAVLLPQTDATDAGDLAPAGIGVAGGVATVSRLRVWRDIYYLADRWDRPDRRSGYVTDYDLSKFRSKNGMRWVSALLNLPTDPSLWPNLADRHHADFQTGEDQFFVMGDNSPASLDARLWRGGNGPGSGKPGGAYLERSLLVGKALCVYWPHAWYALPFTNRVVPLAPNVADMRLVR